RGTQNLSFTVTNPTADGYHDYVLKYDPIQGKANLFVDGSLQLRDFVGFVFSPSSSVGFGDGTTTDGGYALYQTVEWTNCASIPDSSSCSLSDVNEPRVEYHADPDPTQIDGYPTRPGKQRWTLAGLGNAYGKPIIDTSVTEGSTIGWDLNSTGDLGHEE